MALRPITAQAISSENFAPYGQLIGASADGKLYDREDAQLNLTEGIPRFYIMRLPGKGRRFHRITRHQQCTQCLGSLEGKEWFLAVAPPGPLEVPTLEQLRAFRIPGTCFVKLETGTWHAGPYFDGDWVDFYNLELSDTNQTDHFTYDFQRQQQLEFEIV
ncbi:MAG: ureidoglycolate lyase [Cyanobacteria bacterium J06641_5]